MVMFGLHWGFTPVTLDNLTRLGGDPIEGMALAAVLLKSGLQLASSYERKTLENAGFGRPSCLDWLLCRRDRAHRLWDYSSLQKTFADRSYFRWFRRSGVRRFGVTMNAYVFHNIFPCLFIVLWWAI